MVQRCIKKKKQIYKNRHRKTSHKFGIRLPHSVEETLKIDKETGTTHWNHVIKKEMIHMKPAFQRWDDTVEQARSKKEGLVGYQEIKCHMIFN